MMRMPCRLLERLERGQGQRLARGDALAQRRQVEARRLLRQGAVGHGRREADGGAVVLDGLQQVRRRGLLHQQRRRARAHGKEQQPAQPEGERQRGRSAEHVVRRRPQHVAREGVAAGQHVAMEVHGPLGLARRPGGERDERHVVRRRIHRVERRRLRRHQPVQRSLVVRSPRHDALDDGRQAARLLQVRGEAMVREREVHPRLLRHGGELAGAQQGHGGDDDAARLEHPEPARGHHGRVGPAQQHAVARDDTQVVAQHGRDAVAALRQLAVGPAAAVPQDGGAFGVARVRHAVQQLHGAVQPRGIGQPGKAGVVHDGPQLARRQVVAGEGVQVGGGLRGDVRLHRGHGSGFGWDAGRKVVRARCAQSADRGVRNGLRGEEQDSVGSPSAPLPNPPPQTAWGRELALRVIRARPAAGEAPPPRPCRARRTRNPPGRER